MADIGETRAVTPEMIAAGLQAALGSVPSPDWVAGFGDVVDKIYRAMRALEPKPAAVPGWIERQNLAKRALE